MIERLTDRLRGQLDAASERELHEHLEDCAACRVEAEETERLWSDMGRLDEEVPSERMRARLWAALSAYEAAERGGLAGRIGAALERWWPRRPAWQLAITAAALVVGLLLGGRLASGPNAEIRALRGELRSMNETISVSLLRHQSASERLRGVEWSARAGADPKVVDALLDRVSHDPNVNVRLAAIDALSPLIERPTVGAQLLAALDQQNSELVRVSLAELLLESKVPGAENAVQRLFDEDRIDPPAREYLQSLMQQRG